MWLFGVCIISLVGDYMVYVVGVLGIRMLWLLYLVVC